MLPPLEARDAYVELHRCKRNRGEPFQAGGERAVLLLVCPVKVSLGRLAVVDDLVGELVAGDVVLLGARELDASIQAEDHGCGHDAAFAENVLV